MKQQRITDAIVKAIEVPAKGSKITYDGDVKGFGIRVTSNGARSFILNYRTRTGRERRYTIGQWPAWKAAVARTEAGELKRKIAGGYDPLAELEADRTAKTVKDLCERFTDEHLPKLRPATRRDYESLIRREIIPAFKHVAVADVTFSDVDGLHRKITKRGASYLANRTVALLSKMFALAVRWGWRADNPAKGIERNQEVKRHRYLSGDELRRLTVALAEHEDQQAANIVRMLLLTGARKMEVMSARWADIDLAAGVWTKPGSTTKQKTLHRVPLSAPARQLLSEIHEKTGGGEFVFPGRHAGEHRVEIKRAWLDLCLTAKIVDSDLKPTARLHDLRHTYASVLASAGLSLPVIGALLGHSQPATTARYSHLMDDPLREATERAGALVMPRGDGGEVVQIRGGA